MRLMLASLIALLGSTAALSAPAPPAEPRLALPFIEDDYSRALAEAKARNLPLFVDAWAPWCHSCQSMRAYVLTDRALVKLAPHFVWLSIDTEKDQNSAFVARFPIEAWPTLLFIDPRSEGVLLRRLGNATVAQLQGMATEARQAMSGRAAGWQAALDKADRLYGEEKNAEAATAYAAVLREAPAIWEARGRVLESYVLALSASGQARRCAEVARVEYPEVYQTPAALTVASVGLDCAVSLPAADEARAELIKHMEAFAREAAAQPSPAAAADDISGVYLSLHAAREAENDAAGARAVLEQWDGFLAREANAATSASARAVFDSHRLTTALALGQTERAIAMLEASERNLPNDYNAPARLALAYAGAKRYDEALAASDRALAKVYGPRRITLLRQRADILAAKGDRALARQTLDEALGLARALPETPRSAAMIDTILKKQAEIE